MKTSSNPDKNFDLKVESTGFLKGAITAPASKSYTIRAIIAAGLNAKARIINPLFSQDTLAALKALESLGARVKRKENRLEMSGFKGRPSLEGRSLDVRESGTLLRLILPIIALGKGRFKVNGRGTLLKRPNKPIVEAIASMGVDIKAQGPDFRLPIVIRGEGAIPGGKIYVSAGMSSQTISSLLMVSAFASKDTTIIVKDRLVSRPYVDITIDVLARAGINVQRRGYTRFSVKSGQEFRLKEDFIVHGDYSSAAFLIAASCLVRSEVVIKDMAKDKQGDRKIINILNKMGARIKHSGDRVEIRGPFELRGVDIDCSDTPDLVPILLAASCFAGGSTRIYNIGHLAYKESNRITAPAGELRKLGARIEIGRNKIIVRESVLRPRGALSSCDDHRIAMSLAVVGLRTGGLTIRNSECIGKSYPDFIRDFKALGAKFTKILP